MKGSWPLQNLVVLIVLVLFVGLFAFAFLAPQGLVQSVAKETGKILNFIPGLKQDVPSADVKGNVKMEEFYGFFL